MEPGVLITDAHARSAAATCAALGRGGYRVGTATYSPPAPAQWSRYSSMRLSVSDPHEEPRRFVEEIAAAVGGGGFAVVLPGSDASLLAISNHRDAFDDRTLLGLPARQVVDRCVNKLTLVEDTARAGIPTPETVACADPGEAAEAARRLGYPVLLKPRQTVFDQGGALRQRQAFIAHDEGALLAAVPEFGLPCLLQRHEPGRLFSIAAVAADGQLLATTFSRYIRTWPPDAGPVSFSRTETPPPALLERVSALIGGVGWQGIFELELIETADGGFATIDFNPRLYGSIALAVRAGAPIPTVWCDWLLKGEADARPARPGVYYSWEEAAARHIRQQLRRGRILAALSIVRPRLRLARPYLRWSDPGPAAAMVVRLLKSHRADRRSAKAARSPGA